MYEVYQVLEHKICQDNMNLSVSKVKTVKNYNDLQTYEVYFQIQIVRAAHNHSCLDSGLRTGRFELPAAIHLPKCDD